MIPSNASHLFLAHGHAHKWLAMSFLLFVGLLMVNPAEAASCGGLNQKACPAWKKGPQCGNWLSKNKDKICRPCGGRNQKACPVTKKGKVCKSGLKKKKGICVPKESKNCGKLNQKACPAVNRGPQCGPWLTKDENKICRPCGERGQQSCPVVKKGPRCKSGLKSWKKVCVEKPAKASKGLTRQVQTFIGKNTAHIKALSKLNSCMKRDGRKKTLKKAVKQKDSRTASRVVNACLTNDVKRTLRGKPRGLTGNNGTSSDGGYFNTLTIGVGGGLIIGVGVSGDTGVVISLNGNGLKFYTNREFSYGVGLSAGADVSVGLSRQRLTAGEDEGRSVNAGGKFLAGGSASVNFSGHEFPNFRNFDGFSVAGGAGGGAEIGTIYKSTARVY